MNIRPGRRKQGDNPQLEAAALHIQNEPEQEEPAEHMGPGEPVNIPGREEERTHRGGDKKITPRRPMQAEPKPRACSDRETVQSGDPGKPPNAMRGAHQYVRSPFPGKPRRARSCQRIRVDPRETKAV